MESIQVKCRGKLFISILYVKMILSGRAVPPIKLTGTLVQSNASSSLATFGHDPINVGNMLVRMAVVNHTPSSAAVLLALLALASLHRSGLQTQAAELKIAALKALSAASNRVIGTMETLQHVAAGMLLCSFEVCMIMSHPLTNSIHVANLIWSLTQIHQSSCTSGQWRSYIIGVKNVIKASPERTLARGSDFSVLLDWIYYHDVLSRFSLVHWHPPAIESTLMDLDEPVNIPSPPLDPHEPCIEVGVIFLHWVEPRLLTNVG